MKVGEVEIVSPAAGGVDGELVLEDEGAAANDVVNGDEAFEGDGGAVGAVEAIHESCDAGGGGGAGAVADGEERRDVLLVGGVGGVVGCGPEDGHGGVGIGEEEDCFAERDLVFEGTHDFLEEGLSSSAHGLIC